MNKRLIILGTRGIPASHGGFETFAQHLSLYLKEKSCPATVYCQKSEGTVETDEWEGIKRVHLSSSLKGALGTIIFDFKSILHALRHERNSIWLTLGYNTAFLNILPFAFGIKQIFNMDGVEWQRQKWSRAAKAFLYINYLIAGLIGKTLIADHPEIAKMLKNDFKDKNIVTIPYGSATVSQGDPEVLENYNLRDNSYYLLIARLEPENNILPIIRAWSARPGRSKLVIVGNYLSGSDYLLQVRKAASKDIVFTGPIYDQGIIRVLRFHCKAYLHGHSVGGTNPTLVESLGTSSAIIAHDNKYNRWVAGNAGLYFYDENELRNIFDKVEKDQVDLALLKENARQQHHDNFQWEPVLSAYDDLIRNQF